MYPGFAPIAVTSPWGFGNYHSLQLQAVKRTTRGLSVVANFVEGRCMDNTSGQVQGADAGGGSQFHKFNLRSDYAPCDFDVARTANISLVYDLPRSASPSGAASRLLNGWRFTSILAARSALPFTVLSGRDNSFTGAPLNDFADQFSPDASPSGVNPVQKWFNTSAFVENAIGTFGNTQRNTLRGPGFWGLDIGVLKDTKIAERALLQFRFEDLPVRAARGNLAARSG